MIQFSNEIHEFTRYFCNSVSYSNELLVSSSHFQMSILISCIHVMLAFVCWLLDVTCKKCSFRSLFYSWKEHIFNGISNRNHTEIDINQYKLYFLNWVTKSTLVDKMNVAAKMHTSHFLISIFMCFLNLIVISFY